MLSPRESARTVVMQRIGQLIRSYRAHRGLTLRELAVRVRCTPGYLCQIETGKTRRPPSDLLLHQLERAFRLPDGELVEIAAIEQLPAPVRRELVELRQTRAQALQLAELVARLQENAPSNADLTPARAIAAALADAHDPCAPLTPVLNRPGEPVFPAMLPGPDAPCRARSWIMTGGTSHSAFAMHAPDESMASLVEPGDLVVLDGVAEPTAGAWGLVEVAKDRAMVFALTYPGRASGMWRIQPANPAFAPQEVKSASIRAIYRPVALIRPLAPAAGPEQTQGGASGPHRLA